MLQSSHQHISVNAPHHSFTYHPCYITSTINIIVNIRRHAMCLTDTLQLQKTHWQMLRCKTVCPEALYTHHGAQALNGRCSHVALRVIHCQNQHQRTQFILQYVLLECWKFYGEKKVHSKKHFIPQNTKYGTTPN